MTAVKKPARKKLASAFGDDGLVPAERHQDIRGDMLVEAQVKLLTGEQFSVEIGRLWQDAQARFIEIGRRLNEAFSKLEHGEYGQMLASLPFERATADKLRKVAMAADSGVVQLERLPPSYSTVYEVLTLTADERRAAEDEGLLRPDLKRSDLVSFKRRMRSPQVLLAPIAERDRRAELEHRRAKLLAELAEVEAMLERMGR